MGIYSIILSMLFGASVSFATSPPVPQTTEKEFKYWVSKLRLNYAEAVETKDEKKKKLAIKNMKKLLSSQMDDEKKDLKFQIKTLKTRIKELEKNRKKRLGQAESILKANDAMMELEELDL